MADLSNYGVKLGTSGSVSGSYVDIAGLIKLDMPKIKNSTVDSTNHNSGGYAEKVSGKLVEIDDMKGTFSFDKTAMGTLSTACTAGTKMYWQITYPNTATWGFQAYVTEFTPSGADAGSPELLTAEITFGISGSMVIA